jgi:predicted glycoside hydrolase/deacetylase ChbG (UPF0249 family)
VNRGIIETIEHGVVTSASLLVNMPGTDDAIDRLRGLQARGARVSVGLHFNIVAGAPLAACDTLLDERTRRFLPLVVLAWRSFMRRVDEVDVQRELDAQLARASALLEPIGLRVTHIDSHRHTHSLPLVFDVVLRTARQKGIGHVRLPYEASSLLRRPHATAASYLLRALLSNRRTLDNVGFTGIGAMGSRSFDRDLLALLAALPPGTTELMVHPGYDSPELAAIDPYRAPREREVRALTSPSVKERIRELGVELTWFGARDPTA